VRVLFFCRCGKGHAFVSSCIAIALVCWCHQRRAWLAAGRQRDKDKDKKDSVLAKNRGLACLRTTARHKRQEAISCLRFLG
jgi:hypothetical protein